MIFTEKIEKRINLTAIIKIYNINWTRIKLNQTEKFNYLEGKNLSLLLIITTKLYLLPFCDNTCDWNKQKSDIYILTKIWQYVVSLIYCIDKNKNTNFTGLNIVVYG